MTDMDWELVFRYHGNECTPAERARFERWLAEDPAHQRMLDAAVMAAGRSLTNVRAAARPPKVLVAHVRPAPRRAWQLAAAAALLIAVGGTYIGKNSARSAWPSSHAEPAMQVAWTARGRRTEFRLADGTRVMLGAASSLRYPARFDRGPRDVFLTGEGYFEVVHDSAHPFRVHAGKATAEDVGTAFGVSAYAEDSTVRVVVAEGRVAFGASATGAQRQALLTKGQLGTLAGSAAVPAVGHVNVDVWLGWTKGRLVFDETPLSEVAARLGRWFGTPVRIADPSLRSRTLTASFTTESLADVLSALAPVLDVRFERMGDSVLARAR